MNNGVVLFAFNNDCIDYIKQAVYCAKRVKKYLNLPVQLITDDKNYLENSFPFYKKYIDIVTQAPAPAPSKKTFYDGVDNNKGKFNWKNGARDSAYDLSEFDQTLVIDTDLILSNNKLLKCFDTNEEFMIAKHYNYINFYKKYKDLDRLNDKTIPILIELARNLHRNINCGNERNPRRAHNLLRRKARIRHIHEYCASCKAHLLCHVLLQQQYLHSVDGSKI